MKIAKLITASSLLFALMACSGGNATQSQDEDSSSADSIIPTGINALYEYGDSGKHVAGNITYNYKFQFKNDKSLPVVKNPLEYQFYDNKVVLRITKNGQDLLRRTFTKEDFRQLVPESFFETSALIGFCYNVDKENAKDAVYFIATIGDPDSAADSSYAIEVRISSAGDISFSKLQDRETLPVNNGMTVDPEEN